MRSDRKTEFISQCRVNIEIDNNKFSMTPAAAAKMICSTPVTKLSCTLDTIPVLCDAFWLCDCTAVFVATPNHAVISYSSQRITVNILPSWLPPPNYGTATLNGETFFLCAPYDSIVVVSDVFGNVFAATAENFPLSLNERKLLK